MGSTIRIDQMADAIMQGLNEYAELATEDMKKAVKAASKTVKKEIQAGAVVGKAGLSAHIDGAHFHAFHIIGVVRFVGRMANDIEQGRIG